MNTDFYIDNYKKIMLGLGIFVTVAFVYTAFLYFEYNPIIEEWNNSFVSPAHFWSQVPDWKWRPIWQKT